jgi:hypothetical protein
MTMRRGRRAGLAAWLMAFAVLVLGGCAETDTAVGIDGMVRVFSSDPAHPVFGRASDWIELGNTKTMHPTIAAGDGRLALEVNADGANGAALRRLDAPLLAMPFLFWDWTVIDGAPEHPVRVVIGFADQPVAPDSAFTRAFSPAAPPRFSRSVALVWGSSALQRGSIETHAPDGEGRSHVRYVVRGGRENRGRWWSEHLDLSQIHAAAWPDVDMAQSHVVFAGISTAAGAKGTMLVAGLRLSR